MSLLSGRRQPYFRCPAFPAYKLVAVFNAATHRRIADVRVMGGVPKACEDYRYDQQGSVTAYNGSEPDENAFLRAIWNTSIEIPPAASEM